MECARFVSNMRSVAPRLSGSGVLDIGLHPPGPAIGIVAVDVNRSDGPMTSRYNHADTVEHVGKQGRGGGLYVAVQDEFRDGYRPVQIHDEGKTVLFVIEEQQPGIHKVIGTDELTLINRQVISIRSAEG